MKPAASSPASRVSRGRDPDAQERIIRALVSLVGDFTVERDEDGLVASTLEHVVSALGLSGGATYLVGPEEALELRAERSLGPAKLAVTHAFAARTLAEGSPAVHAVPGSGWFVAAPLVTRRRTLGILVLHDDRPDTLLPDLNLLEALGKQIGTGLDNVRLYAELLASSARLAAINRITATLTSGQDLKTVIPGFAREMALVQPFDRLACGLVNDTGDYIEIVGHPAGSSWGLGDVIPVVGSGPGSVVLNNTAILQRDLVHEHRFIEDMRLLEEGVRSYLLLPLNSRGRAIGVLALGSQQSAAYDDSALARLQPLADAVALAFENVRLFQKARELSITDEITPLFNFRHFHQILDRELKLVDRYHSILCLLFLDLDRFKPINDRYGHLRGSRTLREVGFLIRAAVRETDFPARYGGDEFVVILPQTDREMAMTLAEKLRRLIERHVFLQEEGIDARLGVSIGAATYPDEASTKELLIRLADQRMYEDKAIRKQR